MKQKEFGGRGTNVRQTHQIRHRLTRPSRAANLTPADIKAIRDSLGMSQTEFATMIRISAATLRNWEQGRRVPDGPAQALLRVAAELRAGPASGKRTCNIFP